MNPKLASAITPVLARLRSLFKSDELDIKRATAKFKKSRAAYYTNLAALMDTMKDRSYTEFFNTDIERYKNEPRGVLSAYWLSRSEGTNGETQVAFLSEIYAGTVPQEDIAVIAIAERAGDVKAGMLALAESINAMDAIKRSMVTMLGSLAVTFAIVHADLFMFAYVQMPTIVDAMSGLLRVDQFGPKAKAAYYLAMSIRLVGWAVVAGEIVAVYWTAKALSRYIGRFRPALDRYILPFKFYRTFASTQFLAGLSAITKKVGNDQRNLREGLEILGEYSRPWLRYHVEQMQANLEYMPVDRGAIFDTGLFERESMHWIEDLSDHEPDLSVRLNTIAKQILKEAPIRLERAARIVLAIGTIVMVTFILCSYFAQMGINTELKREVKTHLSSGN